MTLNRLCNKTGVRVLERSVHIRSQGMMNARWIQGVLRLGCAGVKMPGDEPDVGSPHRNGAYDDPGGAVGDSVTTERKFGVNDP